jgi:N-acetylglucosamine kinase-like BadF-type ATPase
LAIDIGRTGCRAVLWRGDAHEPGIVASGDGSLGLGAANGPDVAEAAIRAVVGPLLDAQDAGGIDAVGVGVPGAMAAPGDAHRLAAQLARSLPARKVAVTSDAITSHAGALGGKPGVVLAAGTGAVTVAIGGDGAFRKVDGWGPWIGDEGSGAWLGRCGLQAVARAGDGRGPATALTDAAVRQFGSIGELAAKLGADPNPARSMAAFAPAVAKAARDGDPVAMQLLEAGAAALAHSMITAANALNVSGPVAGVIIGGLVNMGPILLDPLHAIRHLAVVEDSIHEPWIARARGNEP